MSRKRARRTAKHDAKRIRRGEAPQTEAKRNHKPKLLGRVLKKNLFYMIIVNMPSQEEMDAALAGVMREEGGEGMSRERSKIEGMEGAEKMKGDGKMDL